MNTFETQLKKAIERVTLPASDRARVRERLLAEIADMPIATAMPRHVYSLSVIRTQLKKTMPIALLIALLMSGGVSYAAEGTLPGDTLYPIKIHVNEGVRGALAGSDSAKAKLEVDLLNRRLVEAEQLKNESRLDATTTLVLNQEVRAHRSRADKHLQSLEDHHNEDAITIGDELELRMSGHSSVLRDLGFEDGDDDMQDDRGGDRSEGGTTTTMRSEGRGEGEGRSRGEHTILERSASTTIDTQKNGADVRGEREEEHASQSSRREQERGGRGGDDEGDDEEDDRPRGLLPVTPPVSASIGGAVTITPPTSGSVTTYTLAQIATHNSASSCYSAISGTVYDLTPFLNGHPGGVSAILSLCGRDGTALYMAQHSGQSRPQSMLASLRIGTLN